MARTKTVTDEAAEAEQETEQVTETAQTDSQTPDLDALTRRIAELEARIKAVAQAEPETAPAASVQHDPSLTELVKVRLFRDSDKYSRDLVVGVNGKLWKIKRGEPVEVPRYVAQIIEQSMAQDEKTAALIEQTDGTYVQYANL
jgi:hypothetical protein